MSTKNYSTPIKKYESILSAVHMVYRLVNSTFNVQELILRLTRLLCQFIKASSSNIFILDSDKKEIVMVANFDNMINTLVTKKKDIVQIPSKEKKVTEGFVIFEKHLIGLPLVADDNIGAVFIRRKSSEPVFNDFDKDILSVVVEQAVTAIKNLQLYEEQQKIILGSIAFIGKLLERHGHSSATTHKPIYFTVVECIAKELHITESEIENLYYASVSHDAGAIDVPYEILSKSSRLSPEEFRVIRKHPRRSVELIKPVEFLKPVLPIILYHHERYDGTGYPSGLKKEQIPLGARIMGLIDAFEAMVSIRPYKKPLTIPEAIEEVKKNSGTQFDPKIVKVFLNLCKQKKFRNCLSLLGDR